MHVPRRYITTLFLVAFGCLCAPGPAQGALGITAFDGRTLKADGTPATLAGSHPALESTSFSLATTLTPGGELLPLESLKDTAFDLPRGLVADAQAVTACLPADFAAAPPACPTASQVGVFTLERLQESNLILTEAPLYELRSPRGIPALFAFQVAGVAVTVAARLRGGGDYGLSVVTTNAPTTILVAGASVEFWGVPADPSHDERRGACLGAEPPGQKCPSPDAADPKAFLTLPTSCAGPLRTDLAVTGWQGGSAGASFLSHDGAEPPLPVAPTGCAALDFSPTLSAQPTTHVPGSPTGLDLDLRLPQETLTDPGSTAEAHLRQTEITLPAGMTIDASAANGLGTCSAAQAGLASAPGDTPPSFTPAAAECPAAAKLGTVEVDTPLLDHPLPGALYLAAPYDNPFGSLLVLYIAIDDPQSGAVVKLAGRIDADGATGRLRIAFADSPQLPFADLKLHLFAGAGAVLTTPPTCGSFSIASSLTPWSAPESGPPSIPEDSFSVFRGPGDDCPSNAAEQPNAPSFDAGTVAPIAATSSPLVIGLRRASDSQRLASLSIESPPGLSADLSGVASCPAPDLAAISSAPGAAAAEIARPSCPAASRVGSLAATAGAGPAPYHLGGSAYLAGPYEGAPFSLAFVVPVAIGPFDLGTVLVRAAVRVDPLTAQLSIHSDPLPQVLSGIPLDLTGLEIDLDRPGFIRNPTRCDAMHVAGAATSTSGSIAALSSRFQLAECANLGFKPRIRLRLSGGLGRNAHPTVTVDLRPRDGDSNLREASVTLPYGEFIDPFRLRDACTRARFAAGTCPPSSRLGWAQARSPLLENPLRGRVYLLESGRRLPDLAADLDGRVRLSLIGHLDALRGRVRASFDSLPDLPLSRLRLVLKGGFRGFLVNSESICRGERRATVSLAGHSGKLRNLRPPVGTPCSTRARPSAKAGERTRWGE